MCALCCPPPPHPLLVHQGVWWEHVVPAAAIAPVPHPALAAEARRRHQLQQQHQQQVQDPQKPNHLAPQQQGGTHCTAAAYALQLRAAAAGLPTARSAAAATLHDTCLDTLCQAVAATASVAAASDTAVQAASQRHLRAQHGHGKEQGATVHGRMSRFWGQDAGALARQDSTAVAVEALTGVLARQPWGLGRPLADAVARWAVAACLHGLGGGGVGGAGAVSGGNTGSNGSTSSLSSSNSHTDRWRQLHGVLFRIFQQSEWLEASYNAHPATSLHWGQHQSAASGFPPPPPPLPGLAVCLQPLAGGPAGPSGTSATSVVAEDGRAAAGGARESCGHGGGGCCSGMRGEPKGWRAQLGLEGWGAVGQEAGEAGAAAGAAAGAREDGAREDGHVGAGAGAGGEGAAGGMGAGRAAAALIAADDGLLRVVAAAYAAHEAVLREVAEGRWPALVDAGG